MSRWMTADEVLTDFCEDLASNPARCRRLRKEGTFRPTPEAEFDEQTEQLRRFLRGQATS